LTAGPAKQQPAPDRPSWRETLTDPAVLAIAAYAVVAIAAAIATTA